MQRKDLRVGMTVAVQWVNVYQAEVIDIPKKSIGIRVRWTSDGPKWMMRDGITEYSVEARNIMCEWSKQEAYHAQQKTKREAACKVYKEKSEAALERTAILKDLLVSIGYDEGATKDWHTKARSSAGVSQPFFVISSQALLELASHHPAFIHTINGEDEDALDTLLEQI